MATERSMAEFMESMKLAVGDELGQELAKKVKGVIKFDMGDDGEYTIDLKNGAGSVVEGPCDVRADITVLMSEADFVLLGACVRVVFFFVANDYFC